MTISQRDAERLHQAGFLVTEIEALSVAKMPDGKDQPPINLDSPAWQAVLQSRSSWRDRLVQKGWDEEGITNEIRDYYRKDDRRSPWDFLKAEYRPQKKVDYLEARRAQMAKQIEGELEGYSL